MFATRAFALFAAAMLGFAGEVLAVGLAVPSGGLRLPAPSTLTLSQDAPEISPNEAAQKAQLLNNGGKILAVEAVAGGYRVKLLKDGEVKIIFVPN